MRKQLKKRIVVIGGGTGCSVVLSGLRDSGHELTAIVSMADNGGSSGALRSELGVLPPGDARQCLAALSLSSGALRDVFGHRFSKGALKGHTVGNIVLAAAELAAGNFSKAVRIVGEMLRVEGRVLASTLTNTDLVAELQDGTVLFGEAEVTASHGLSEIGVRRVFLRPEARANPEAVAAIRAADLIVIAPGNLYSSLIPNFLIRGIARCLSASRAHKVYVANLMTQKGHTDGFRVHDFSQALERHVGEQFLGTVLYNIEPVPARLLNRYRGRGETVRFDSRGASQYPHIRFVGKHLLSPVAVAVAKNDPLASQRSFIRHDPKRLAMELLRLP